MSNLIPVSKGADYLEVHPNAVDEHRRLGWAQCAARYPGPADSQGDDKKLSVADIRAALTERGIEFDPGAKKADLQALLDATGNPVDSQDDE